MVAMIGTKVQQESFKSRLGRIHAGGVNTSRHVYIGPVDEAVGEKGSKRKAERMPKAPGERSFFGETLMIPVAIAAGAIAVLAARVIAFRFLTEQSFYSTEFYGVTGSTIAVVAIALALALVLRLVLGLKGGVRGRALLAGLIAMALFEPMAIAHAPELFAPLYSADYVAEVVAKAG